jgi:hypothetical protein
MPVPNPFFVGFPDMKGLLRAEYGCLINGQWGKLTKNYTEILDNRL